jgi:hypothetical protein
LSKRDGFVFYLFTYWNTLLLILFKYLFYSNTYFIQILILFKYLFYSNTYLLFKYFFNFQYLFYSNTYLLFKYLFYSNIVVGLMDVWIVDEVGNLALLFTNFSKSLSHVILWHFSGRFSHLSLFYRIYYSIPFPYKKEINLTHTKTQG